ncbi:hypothetical protein D3273_11915 [Lichenibacterium minor]|uniref:Uncharacterized protein n=1 Tax=Lichenibacterium minor TaxID=2316528 RepID=A0A4Q2U9R0_9HYPH|nr:DUF5666 domain-containing protein [Lichenibacterium minor]RYC31827.1 hypothetical protein D3273_11915 [Lichenibacterium minor]
MLTRRALTAAAALCLLGGAAMAQSATRLRGTVVSIDGTALRIHDAAGHDVQIALSPTYTVTALVPAKLGDVTPGSFIGAAANTQPDGTLVAKEIHIFPEAMRGSGEGHRAFDLGPQSTMTNGTVGNEVKGAAGDTLTVAYKGGEKSITVPKDAPIVMFAPGDRAMLAPGAHVIVQAQAGEGGGLTAERVTVGKDGLVPPM